jgi:hypothetical protein
MAAAYAKPLQLKLQETGLQGTLDADAFQALLNYVAGAYGSLDAVYSILEQLKLGRRFVQAGQENVRKSMPICKHYASKQEVSPAISSTVLHHQAAAKHFLDGISFLKGQCLYFDSIA